MLEEFLWSQKYRPRRVADCVIPERLKAIFQGYVNNKDVPNMTLTGPPGIGKTTIATAMLNELGSDFIVINGSLNGNIDTLRHEVSTFATAMSFTGGRKYVIFDEADYLNANSTQPALRNFMEEYSANCGFILTANFPNRLIEALISRCPIIDFSLRSDERPQLAKAFYQRLISILTSENVEYDRAVLIELIKRYHPDWRRIISLCQQYAPNGKIDTGIFAKGEVGNFDALIESLKKKNFPDVRKWVGENLDADTPQLLRKFYESVYDLLEPESVPQAVVLLAEYQYKSAFVADPQINLAAMFAELMVNCKFK